MIIHVSIDTIIFGRSYDINKFSNSFSFVYEDINEI